MASDEIILRRAVGDTLTPVSAILVGDNGNPVSLSGKTVTFQLAGADGVDVYAESATDVTKEPTQDFTATANSISLSCVGHGLRNGQQVILTTTGTLPTGLATATRYFVRNAKPNTFSLATQPDGNEIAPTGAGTGTHSIAIVGHAQWAPTSGAVDEAGSFYGCFRVTSGGKTDTFPSDEHRLKIVIEERP